MNKSRWKHGQEAIRRNICKGMDMYTLMRPMPSIYRIRHWVWDDTKKVHIAADIIKIPYTNRDMVLNKLYRLRINALENNT